MADYKKPKKISFSKSDFLRLNKGKKDKGSTVKNSKPGTAGGAPIPGF